MLLRNATITTQAYLNNQQLGEIKVPILSLEKQKRIIQLIENAYKEKRQKEREAEKILGSIDDYVLEELGIRLPELKDAKYYIVKSDEINRRIDPYYYQPKFKAVSMALEKAKYIVEQLKKFITKIHYGVSIKNVYVDEGIPLIRLCTYVLIRLI
jgi:type I restriction enzyme M protein